MATKKPAKTAPPSPDMDARPLRYAPAAAALKPKETPKRGKELPPPLVDVGVRASGGASPVRDAPADEVITAAAPPPRKMKTKRVKRSTPPPRGIVVASPDHNKRGTTSPPAQEGEEMVEHDHAGNISAPHQEKDEDAGAVEVSSEALSRSERDASSPEQKKPAVERSWSQDDELKILNALVEHAQSNGGALPDSSHLLAKLIFDKTDANADKLIDKIRKLKARYHRLRLQGRPTDKLGRRLFELSAVLWSQAQGQGDDDNAQVEAASTVELSQRSASLYPHLAEEIKAYAKTHASGDFIMAAFTNNIDDDKARHLDAMCKKQRVDAFNLELSQANLTKAMLSAFSGHIN